MASDNSEQIREWNGPLGERWAREQEVMDQLAGPFGQAALTAAAAREGERAIDIGCGCGDTSIALAQAVGSRGSVLGLDVSAPMLGVARQRAAGLAQLRFEQADASQAPLPEGQDLLYSRFGVMFFDAPVPAFAHLRRSLKPAGRLAFVCWQSAKENLWASVPVAAGRTALGITPPPADPHAPGPFAFADADRVQSILSEAGFAEISAEPFSYSMPMGDSPRKAAEESARLGPLARLVREAGPEHLPKIVDAVEAVLRPLAARDGSVSLPARAWIVTAHAGRQ
jgi:SAM-dependent methyltransferase